MIRLYENCVPWVLDKADIKIIARLHGKVDKKTIIEKLWINAQK
jgi:hypothetical protein